MPHLKLFSAALSIALSYAPLAAAAESNLQTDTLERLLAGQGECYLPNEAKKTCWGLSYYKRLNDIEFINTGLTLISEGKPAIAIEMKVPVNVGPGIVCGKFLRDYIVGSKLFADGKPMPEAEAAPMLAELALVMGPVLKKHICNTYEVGPKGLVANLVFRGVPILGIPMKWVKPSDGYRVAP